MFNDVNGNIGLCPKNAFDTKSATTAETNPTMTIDLSNPLLISSKVNMNPARGALKVAASPAPLPQTNKRFSSVCCLATFQPTRRPPWTPSKHYGMSS